MTYRPWPFPGPGGADLHAHTDASDGALSAEELVSLAVQRELAALAVCDHDTLGSLPAAARTAARAGMRLVPGVEINTEVGRREVHVLGYFCRGGEALRDLLDDRRRDRERRMEEMVRRLRAAGIDVDLGAVRAVAGAAALGRPHLARALVAAGLAADTDQAFRRYLVRGAPGFVPRRRMSPAAAVAAITADGGVPVLAHPGLIGDDGVIAALVPAGLRGLEVWHSDHSRADAERYAALARSFGLLATGGSDYHGPGGRRELGAVRVGPEVLAALETARG